jgi:hypothetical protein
MLTRVILIASAACGTVAGLWPKAEPPSVSIPRPIAPFYQPIPIDPDSELPGRIGIPKPIGTTAVPIPIELPHETKK